MVSDQWPAMQVMVRDILELTAAMAFELFGRRNLA